MAAKVYFGNLRSAQYIKAPDVGLGASLVGSINSTIFSGGGAFATVSGSTHREYNLSWSTGQIEDFQFLFDYRNGLKGSGLLYWIDPYAAYWNAFPPHWADPFLTLDKWPSLTGTAQSPAPVTVTPAGGSEISTLAAQYTVQGVVGQEPDRGCVLLIPNDQQLVVGFTGAADGAVVRAQPYDLNGTPIDTVDLTLLASDANARYSTTFAGDTYSAVKFYITSTVAGGSTITLACADAVYAPLYGDWASNMLHRPGRGHTGLRFKSDPTLAYTLFDPNGVVPRRYASAAASFTEVGAWL